MKELLSCLAIVLSMQMTTFAVAAHELEAGLYEIKVQVELPNVIHPAHENILTRCITNDDIARHDSFRIESETPLSNCHRTPICKGGGKAGFQIICGGGTGGVAHANFSLSKTHFTGTIKMNMGGKNMTSIERQVGRRMGACQDEF